MWVLLEAIDKFVYVIELLIIARIFITFITRDFANPIVKFIYQVTEPILAPCRNLISRIGIRTGMFDFSPLLAFLFLSIGANLLKRLVLMIWW